MKTHEFWRERGTGEVWAVELVEGVVNGTCGPLAHDDVDERFLGAYSYTRGRARWIEDHREAFDLYDAVAVVRPH